MSCRQNTLDMYELEVFRLSYLDTKYLSVHEYVKCTIILLFHQMHY